MSNKTCSFHRVQIRLFHRGKLRNQPWTGQFDLWLGLKNDGTIIHYGMVTVRHSEEARHKTGGTRAQPATPLPPRYRSIRTRFLHYTESLLPTSDLQRVPTVNSNSKSERTTNIFQNLYSSIKNNVIRFHFPTIMKSFRPFLFQAAQLKVWCWL